MNYWSRNDIEKENRFVKQLKNVFTPNKSHVIAFELLPVDGKAASALRLQIGQINFGHIVRKLHPKILEKLKILYK